MKHCIFFIEFIIIIYIYKHNISNKQGSQHNWKNEKTKLEFQGKLFPFVKNGENT